VAADIGRWAEGKGETFYVVFSNAALQWVEDHGRIFVKLMGRVSPGGAMAMQMPGNFDAPAHVIMREIAESAKWKGKFPAGGVREWHVHELDFYYDVLSPVAVKLDLWETEYLHILESPGAIVEWYKGTGLRPFLDALSSDGEREEFLAEYLERIAETYRPRWDGKVIFPFRRLFAIAYREA
jgi:trans-aconitate 2-methyltransferase